MNIQSIELAADDADAVTVPNVDPAVVKALAAIDEARALRKGIVAKVRRLEDAVAEAEAKADLASLLAEGPDPTGEGEKIYAEALAEASRLNADLARAKRATDFFFAKQKIYEAKVAFHEVSKAGLIHKFEQLTVQRAKAAQRVIEAAKPYAEAKAAFKTACDKISYALPHSLQQRTGGLLLRGHEVSSAMPFLDFKERGELPLEFVGLNSGSLEANTQHANEVILQRVAAGPSPALDDEDLDNDLPEVIEDAAPSQGRDFTNCVPPKRRIEL
jgi:hypothetical protein